MTKAAVPEGGGGSTGSKGRGAGWWEEWVEVTRTTALGDLAPCL